MRRQTLLSLGRRNFFFFGREIVLAPSFFFAGRLSSAFLQFWLGSISSIINDEKKRSRIMSSNDHMHVGMEMMMTCCLGPVYIPFAKCNNIYAPSK